MCFVVSQQGYQAKRESPSQSFFLSFPPFQQTFTYVGASGTVSATGSFPARFCPALLEFSYSSAPERKLSKLMDLDEQYSTTFSVVLGTALGFLQTGTFVPVFHFARGTFRTTRFLHTTFGTLFFLKGKIKQILQTSERITCSFDVFSTLFPARFTFDKMLTECTKVKTA